MTKEEKKNGSKGEKKNYTDIEKYVFTEINMFTGRICISLLCIAKGKFSYSYVYKKKNISFLYIKSKENC